MVSSSKWYKVFVASGIVGVLFLVTSTQDAHAQSDKDKPFLDSPKADAGLTIDGEQSNKFPFKESGDKGEPAREYGGDKMKTEKELRAEGKSTLSFNLFLFVLDRLKEN